MSSVLIGVFDNSSQARAALAKIAAAGIDPAAMDLNGVVGSAPAQRADGPRAAPAKPGVLDRFFADLFGNSVDAATYTEAVQRGHCVLTVTVAHDDLADKVSTLMASCGAFDIDERAEQWQARAHPAQHRLQPDEEVGPRAP